MNPTSNSSNNFTSFEKFDKKLNKLSEASALRFDPSKNKLVTTNIVADFFRRIFSSAEYKANKELLIENLTSFLKTNQKFITPQNKEKIDSLCKHAGIIANQKPSDLQISSLSTKQKELLKEISWLDLVIHIKKKYPKFRIKNYTSISELQNKGHPLHFALKRNDSDLFKLLCNSGADIHQLDNYGNNIAVPLFQNYPLNEADLLIKNLKINIHQKNHQGTTPLEILCEHFERINEKQYKYLLSYFDTITDENRKAAEILVHRSLTTPEKQTEKITEHLINSGIDVNTPDEFGRTILYNAVSNNNFAIIDRLLKKGADPQAKTLQNNIKGMFFLSPLELAKQKKSEYLRAITSLGVTPKARYGKLVEQTKSNAGLLRRMIGVFKDSPTLSRLKKQESTAPDTLNRGIKDRRDSLKEKLALINAIIDKLEETSQA